MSSFFKKSKKPAKTITAPKLPPRQRISQKQVLLKNKDYEFQRKFRPDARTWIWAVDHNDLPDPAITLRKPTVQIKLSHKIQELDIQHENSWEMSDLHLNFLAQSLKGLSCLQILDLYFEKCPQINDEGLYALASGLYRLPLLQNLIVKFLGGPFPFTDKGVHSLSSSIKRLRGLKRLELGFDDCARISDVSLNNVSRSLKDLKMLESLYLKFSNCGQISDAGIWYLSENLKRLSGSLKGLSLNFSNGGLSDIGIKFFKEIFEKLVLLQRVDLRFRLSPNITNFGLKCITKGLEKLTLLKDITLDFGYCGGITDSSLEDLGRVFKGLRDLEAVRVDCSGSEISDAGLCFVSEIASNIKILEVDFSGCCNLTDAGVQNLDLKKFVLLKTLTISLWECDQITDTAFEAFSKELSHLVLLKNLRLHFGRCSKFTDKGFFSLCEAFQKLVLLESIELEFSGCSGITRSGGEKLCEILETFGSSLKTILWNFDGVNVFSIAQLQMLGINVNKNVKLLERFALIYNNNQRIIFDGKQDIGRKIWYRAECLTMTDDEAAESAGEEEQDERNEKHSEPEEVKEEEGEEHRGSEEVKEEEVQKRCEQKEQKEQKKRFGGLKGLFGCFMKKQKRKPEIMANDQL